MNTLQPLKTAVLFIIFNRPEATARSLEAIRAARPPRLYVTADGPRTNVPSDINRCEETRRLIDTVDWPCEVYRLFHDKNYNCGRGPVSAMNWFFSREEQGIILEDDCVASPSFFRYCEELLEKYKDDTRVMHIGGNNFLNGWKKDKDYSYYFSRSGHIWGWATWRRAWRLFDFDIKIYPRLRARGHFDNYFLNSVERKYRLDKFDDTARREGKVDWWDYQWDFARYVHSGLAIVPTVNLVANIGFDGKGTHTHANSAAASLEAHEIELPLKHPPFMIRDVVSERRYFREMMKDKVLTKLEGWGVPVSLVR